MLGSADAAASTAVMKRSSVLERLIPEPGRRFGLVGEA
jgi:hypothetical protein